MPALLITYNASQHGPAYQNLLSEIRKYPLTRLTPSTYVIQTECSRSEVFNLLQRHIDPQDTLYVIHIKDAIGWGDKEANRFLAEHLNGMTSATLH